MQRTTIHVIGNNVNRILGEIYDRSCINAVGFQVLSINQRQMQTNGYTIYDLTAMRFLLMIESDTDYLTC